jgi:hypothetical protein
LILPSGWVRNKLEFKFKEKKMADQKPFHQSICDHLLKCGFFDHDRAYALLGLLEETIVPEAERVSVVSSAINVALQLRCNDDAGSLAAKVIVAHGGRAVLKKYLKDMAANPDEFGPFDDMVKLVQEFNKLSDNPIKISEDGEKSKLTPDDLPPIYLPEMAMNDFGVHI